jgi:hypothetical protein
VDELADSRGLAGDPVALRARLAADGYVFLRGLLPADPVRAAGERVAAALRAGGWTAAGAPLLGRAAGPQEALADPAYRAAVTSLAFNALPYLAPLRQTVRRILGLGAFSYPVKVLRAVAPESPAERTRGWYIHCDYTGSGVQDMLTSFINPVHRNCASASPRLQTGELVRECAQLAAGFGVVGLVVGAGGAETVVVPAGA